MSSRALTKLVINFEEIHELSCDLLELFQEHEIPVGTALVTLLLTAGRLSSDDVIEPADEGAFIQAALEWVGTYFAKGAVN